MRLLSSAEFKINLGSKINLGLWNMDSNSKVIQREEREFDGFQPTCRKVSPWWEPDCCMVGREDREVEARIWRQTITLEDFQGLCLSSGLWGRSMEVEVKNVSFEIRSRYKCRLCHSLALWLQQLYPTPPSLRFLTCRWHKSACFTWSSGSLNEIIHVKKLQHRVVFNKSFHHPFPRWGCWSKGRQM